MVHRAWRRLFSHQGRNIAGMPSPAQNAPRYLTYQQAQKRLSIPLPTLYSMVSRLQIPHYRLGPRFVRFREDELEDWLLARRVAVQS